MIKLLGIVGSPRSGGNTETVLMEVLRAAEGEGAETELIHLTDYDIRPCSGCEACLETRGRERFRNQDRRRSGRSGQRGNNRSPVPDLDVPR